MIFPVKNCATFFWGFYEYGKFNIATEKLPPDNGGNYLPPAGPPGVIAKLCLARIRSGPTFPGTLAFFGFLVTRAGGQIALGQGRRKNADYAGRDQDEFIGVFAALKTKQGAISPAQPRHPALHPTNLQARPISPYPAPSPPQTLLESNRT